MSSHETHSGHGGTLILRIILMMVLFGVLVAIGGTLFQLASQDRGVVQSAHDTVAEITNPIQSHFNRLIEKEKVITVTDSGFVPDTLNVWPFDQVYWINQTNELVTIEELSDESNDSPTFSLGLIPPGESTSTYFMYQGSYRYHDRNHPERTGFINVE